MLKAETDAGEPRPKKDGGRDVEIPTLSTSGLGNYDASKTDGAAYPGGTVRNKWKAYPMAMDRGVRFSLDRMDPGDTGFIAVAENVIREFARNALVKEQDAYRIHRLYALLAADAALSKTHIISTALTKANALSPDHEGIVNLCASDLVLTDRPIEARDYAVLVAGLLAALPLTRSATYAQFPEVVSCALTEEADKAVDAGKLILVPGQEGWRLGRAVNSFVSTTVEKAAPFPKIEIVEGVDLIRTDIARAFETGYIGQVLNDYDNKLLLVTAINAYLRGLEGDMLDKTADNRYFISLEGQRSYLESRVMDTGGMKDAEILRANTGSEVFLEAKLTFCDAMEDLPPADIYVTRRRNTWLN